MIRKIEQRDRADYLALAREFYCSPAVMHSVPEEHFERTFEELMRSGDYAECYIFEVDRAAVGYALLAKTFSQEAGGPVCWLEELYVRSEYRCRGIGREFFALLQDEICPDISRFRLEVERDNSKAIALYERLGFEQLDYIQMIKEHE